MGSELISIYLNECNINHARKYVLTGLCIVVNADRTEMMGSVDIFGEQCSNSDGICKKLPDQTMHLDAH